MNATSRSLKYINAYQESSPTLRRSTMTKLKTRLIKHTVFSPNSVVEKIDFVDDLVTNASFLKQAKEIRETFKKSPSSFIDLSAWHHKKLGA